MITLSSCSHFLPLGLRRKVAIRNTVFLQTAARRYVCRHKYIKIRSGILSIQSTFLARRKRRRIIMRDIVYYWQLLVKQTKRSKVQLLVRLMIKKLGIIHRFFRNISRYLRVRRIVSVVNLQRTVRRHQNKKTILHLRAFCTLKSNGLGQRARRWLSWRYDRGQMLLLTGQ